MIANPVFGNELRKSLVRRKPLQCFAIWAGVMAALMYVAVSLPALNAGIFIQFPHIMLPIIAPAFAAGAFAKEHEQRTWQDLMLTRLTTRELLFGKFFACYLPILALLFTLAAPVLFGMMQTAGMSDPYAYGSYSYFQVTSEQVVPVFTSLLLKCLLQGAFYVSMAMVCSHYCSKARQALAVSYVSLALYAVLAYYVVYSIDASVHGWFRVGSIASYTLQAGEQMHLLTCGILTVGAWVLLSVGLKFNQE
jgi:ABC-type transport system involved in multi-copper enzyme maturation permease subunit